MAVNWNQAHIEALTARAVMATIARIITGTQEDAVSAILSPPKSGKVYKRGTVSHQASAPGEAPANDLGRLANSGIPTLDNNQLVGTLRFATSYAAALELGTVKMSPRPYLLPAFIKNAADRDRMLAQEMKAVGL